MAMLHERLPKDKAPEQGGVYTVVLNNAPIYDAEIVKYGGGCWATVKVVRPLEGANADLYTPGSEFDVRVAMYEFRK